MPMFYLIRADDQRAVAETFDRAAALIARGWELTTRDDYMARWMLADADRVAQLAAARCVPLLEQEVGTHYSV